MITLAPIKLLRQLNQSLKISPFLSNGNYGKNYRTNIAPLQSESSKLNTTLFSVSKEEIVVFIGVKIGIFQLLSMITGPKELLTCVVYLPLCLVTRSS